MRTVLCLVSNLKSLIRPKRKLLLSAFWTCKELFSSTPLIFLFFLLYSFTCPTSAYAQDSFSLSVYPPLLEVIIKPGKAITQVYKIGNQTKDNIEVFARMVPFKPTGTQGDVNLIFEKSGFDKAINWFTLQNADKNFGIPFQVKAEETQELVLKIKVPEKTEEKDYYYTLVVQALPQILSVGQTRAQATGIIGANILLTVSQTDQLPKDLDITHFLPTRNSFLPNLVDSFDEIGFEATVKNKGRHFTKMEGEIIVKGHKGQEVQKLPILPTNILAFAQREIVCVDAPGCSLSKRLIFGRYQATLSVASRLGKTEKSLYFFVLPLKASGLFILFGLSILVFVKLLKITLFRS